MTMLDEEQLRAQLKDAADEFVTPSMDFADVVGSGRVDAARNAWMARPKDLLHRLWSSSDIGAARGLRGRRLTVVVAGLGLVAVLAVGLVFSFAPASQTPAPRVLSSAGIHAAAGPPKSLNPTSVGSTASGSAQEGFSGSSGGVVSGGAVSTPSVASTAPSHSTSLPSDVGQSPEIERSGSATLEVKGDSVNAAVTQLTNIALVSGGFVASSDVQQGSGQHPTSSGEITLQVPTNTLGTVIAQLSSLGKVSLLETRATNVTGQYVDLQARITALEDSRQQYLTILTKATSIGDILSVQSQLDTIQSELEQLQGQLQVMNGQTTYASFAVSIDQRPPKPLPAPSPPSAIDRAWHHAISSFSGGFDALVRNSGGFLFFLVCLAAILVAGRWGWRRVARRAL
jgi:hypothetical protein